ncbi:hypothetical protein TSTA_058380 [Talaromyces stipitatus ATCC 10500]|uniref:Uncharacterized protein n=1 Tax=Talaromyces stipitatus (strain ATCC 10500 / CBS 375.48 / QM 6759 / NRRL 1006) TaxID=441959 RepID=B8MQE8_TALSN|nr:uncharacterized protein TSTA_058380 [Talaromyces stipitatus ATCC 10500]EED13350.1 hypothetical protein TSTA_058380 [Talaromyces stipitatus ATCC 10500]
MTPTTSQVNLGHTIQTTDLIVQLVLKFYPIYRVEKAFMTTSMQDNSFREMDGVPLALTSAGMYLQHTTMSVKDYPQIYQDLWESLHK